MTFTKLILTFFLKTSKMNLLFLSTV